MLGDAELQALDGNLKAIARDSQTNHENLQNLLAQFHSLLENYNRLKSDYEEEKEGRERYKKLARAQERNPFVLVLVDGDGYLEHLIKAGAQGGIKAARLLGDSIKELVQERLGSQADQCRIMVRIYSNMLGLSKSLARSGLVGFEARSLSTFAASFTRAQDLFDYVDAGDKKEGADYKIRELFRLFVDNNQCKHIFFAGCHDTGYLSLLTPYRGNADRVTLIKAASFHPEFNTLDFAVRELPAVFMPTQMNPMNPMSMMDRSHLTSAVTTPTPKVCKHYQKGTCRYGNECTKIHIMPNQQLSNPRDDISSHSISSHTLINPSNVREQDFYAKYLPIYETRTANSIPVNKDGERIDPYAVPPSAESWDAYKKRHKQIKPCNNYHLGGECDNENCDFDHSPLDASSLNVMRYILRQNMCSTGARCRSLKCYLGHHCQRGGCKLKKPCKYSRHFHSLDVTVAQWETPAEQQVSVIESPVSESSVEASSSAGWNPANGISTSSFSF